MKFWMVYIEGRNAPAFKHATLEAARAEAERLAQAMHGRAVLLEAISHCEVKAVEWVEFAHSQPTEEVPF